MPKYKPTYEDMYATEPCFICGNYVLNEGDETCSNDCAARKKDFEEDWEWFQWREIETKIEYPEYE